MEIGKGYTAVEWREDLKKILRKSAEGSNHAVFLFTDTQIKEENFLEDISNLLNTGEVPNMFPIDEKNEICSKMRQIDKWVNGGCGYVFCMSMLCACSYVRMYVRISLSCLCAFVCLSATLCSYSTYVRMYVHTRVCLHVFSLMFTSLAHIPGNVTAPSRQMALQWHSGTSLLSERGSSFTLSWP